MSAAPLLMTSMASPRSRRATSSDNGRPPAAATSSADISGRNDEDLQHADVDDERPAPAPLDFRLNVSDLRPFRIQGANDSDRFRHRIYLLHQRGQSSNRDWKVLVFARIWTFCLAPSQPAELLAHIGCAFHLQPLRSPAKGCCRILVDGFGNCDLSGVTAR